MITLDINEKPIMEGILPGALTNRMELRMLLCYILHNVKAPMTLEQMHIALSKDGLVNYFELAHLITVLLDSGHFITVKSDDEEDHREFLTVTPLGSKTAEYFESKLPITVREKALKASKEALIRERLEKENKVEITKRDDGYSVTLCISDVGTNLMELSLFVPSEEHCRDIKEKFLQDPTVVYRGLISLLLNQELGGVSFIS